MSIPPTTPLAEIQKEAIALFKFYEEKGFKDKQLMISLVTLLLPVVFGLLAFCGKTLMTGLGTSSVVENWIAGLAAFVAAVLSGYAWVITQEFLTHANKNYQNTNCALQITELPCEIKRLLTIPAPPGKPLVSTVFRRLWWTVGGLCMVSVGIFVLVVCLRREFFASWLQ
jgi:hypothetical protein